MIIDIFNTGERRKLLVLLLGLLPGILVIRGIVYDPSVLNFHQMNRLAYPMAHPNPAGLLFSISIPLALAIIASQNGWLRAIAVGSLGLQFAGLILTYSRGAWMGCVVSLLVIGFFVKTLRRSVVVLALAGFVVLLAVPPLRDRVITLENPTSDIAIAGRLKFMAHAFVVALEHPFFGVGYGRDRLREGIKEKIPAAERSGFIPHSHNVYTELLAETGLVGLGAFLWMVVSNITRLIRRAQIGLPAHERIGYLCLAASLIAFLVDGLGDVPFYNHETRIFFFTLLALSYLVLRTDVVRQRQTHAAFFTPR
jgi:putative inorganic carbon (HCO3(-)) transporter